MEHDSLPLMQMHEVEIIYKRPVYNEMPHIDSASRVYEVLKSVINLERIDYKEFLWVLLVNNANRVIGISRISEGTSTGTIVNLREIIQLGLCSNASGIILAHNHPSGKLVPSKADIGLTEKVKTITKLFDMNLLDHLIITSEGYYSFADEHKI